MAASSSFHDSLFSMNTLLHMITIKLSSTNYLLWRNHMIPIFTYQKLIGHINGTSISPSPKVTIEGKANPNPDLLTWTEDDQRAVILLQSSLTEEAAAEVLGLTTAHQIWLSLEAAYSNASVERIHLLRDSLRQLKKGTSSVSDYCRRFKALCNQLSAIGHPVVEIDKLHWFLCGLGPSYETFSTAIRATKPAPMFRDLVTQAESHELFLQSLHGTPTPPAVFHVETTNTDSAQGGGRSNRGNHSRGRGRGHNRRPPHCQLCLTNDHYATTCPSLYTYATQASPSSDESLAKAFHAQCHVNTNTPNWHVDSGATDHMTPACDSLHHSSPYPGNAKVMFGNGKTLPITHTGSTTVSHDIPLRNVLVIPKLNKKLLSVSKLTTDHPVDVLFSQPFFYIHDRKTKRVLARGRCEHGLYVLKDEPTAFIATAKVIKPASYELWHARLGHVSFDVISTLNKLGVLSITSLLPKPILCTPCQLAKGQRLPFTINAKRSSHPLDLIHCDLWGPAPICSKGGYRYYVAFIDDYSRHMENPADTIVPDVLVPFRYRKIPFYLAFSAFSALDATEKLLSLQLEALRELSRFISGRREDWECERGYDVKEIFDISSIIEELYLGCDRYSHDDRMYCRFIAIYVSIAPVRFASQNVREVDMFRSVMYNLLSPYCSSVVLALSEHIILQRFLSDMSDASFAATVYFVVKEAHISLDASHKLMYVDIGSVVVYRASLNARSSILSTDLDIRARRAKLCELHCEKYPSRLDLQLAICMCAGYRLEPTRKVTYKGWVKKDLSISKRNHTSGTLVSEGFFHCTNSIWNDFKALLVEEFCPSNEMEKLENEFWNHTMIGANNSPTMTCDIELAQN
ncbi:putative RNA-directed DNA polymerase [Tanacetum coccineum]